MIEYRRHVLRRQLMNERGKLFVFGDNLARRGYGGQAKEMRGEPNAVGIPTKRAPSMVASAFLRDADVSEWAMAASFDIERLCNHDGPIVWPSAGIGTGLARLRESAPEIHRRIEILRQKLDGSGPSLWQNRP